MPKALTGKAIGDNVAFITERHTKLILEDAASAKVNLSLAITLNTGIEERLRTIHEKGITVGSGVYIGSSTVSRLVETILPDGQLRLIGLPYQVKPEHVSTKPTSSPRKRAPR